MFTEEWGPRGPFGGETQISVSTEVLITGTHTQELDSICLKEGGDMFWVGQCALWLTLN